MLRLIYMAIITDLSCIFIHLSIHKSPQSSVVNNNNINWYIHWAVCSQRDVLQNWRMVEVGIVLWRPSSPIILFKSEQQVPQDHVIRFWISLRMKPQQLLWVVFLECLINLTVRKPWFFVWFFGGFFLVVLSFNGSCWGLVLLGAFHLFINYWQVQHEMGSKLIQWKYGRVENMGSKKN